MEENTENYTEISAEEFAEILRGENKNYNSIDNSMFPPKIFINIQGVKVTEPIYIDTEHLSFDITFTSGFFQEINFTEVPYEYGLEGIAETMENELKKPKVRNYKQARAIEIKDGSFDSLKIYSGFFENLNVGENVKLNNLNIKEGNILKLSLSGRINKVLIEGGIYTSIGTRKLKTNSFQINGGIFKEIFVFYIEEGILEINNGLFECIIHYLGDVDLYVREGTFKSQINISGENIEEIILAGGLFLGNINIDENSNVKKLSIHGGIYEQMLHIQKKIQLYISGGDFKNKIFIELNENKDESLKIISNHDAFLFYGGNISFLEILLNTHLGFLNFSDNCIIKNVSIISNIEKTYIHMLSLENNIYQGCFFKVANLQIGYIRFFNFFNSGNVIFNNIKKQKVDIRFNKIEMQHVPLFQIHNSDLGKTTFIDCDFEEMKLDFKSSKITEVFLAGTKMPKEITTTDNDINVANEQKRLGYGQLKKIYDNRGDTVTANEYFAKEMNVFLKKKGIGVGEKINVGLNWFSSNHGTNWLKALGSTLLVAIFFFWLYGMSIGIYPTYEWNKQTSEVFCKYAGYFVEFINPFHKADYIPQDFYDYTEKRKIPISGLTRFIDGISRIFIAYFVYQLIQAFRKHRRGS